MTPAAQQILVGDVGGTHARFAVVDVSAKPWQITHGLDFDEDFKSFTDSVHAYLDRAGLRQIPEAAAIAVAGPVTKGSATFTNRGWTATEDELKALGFTEALLINDFGALAFAADDIPASDLHSIGPDLSGLADEPISILGAGTGFGASCLARFRGRAVPIATETGHAGFAPSDAREIEVLRLLLRRLGRVSIERILSGPGIENLHIALAEIAGRKPRPLSAEEITAGAMQGDGEAKDTAEAFCAIYGSVAGDIALAHGARGGVYLAGGIAQKLEGLLKKSKFRARFEDKGRLSAYVKTIPTKLILNEDAAFLGAAHASLAFRSNSPGTSSAQ